jgi:glutamine synthetase
MTTSTSQPNLAGLADDRPELSRVFGCKCFREAIIRERLPRAVYESYIRTIELGKPIHIDIAPQVAKALMSWAIAQGASHYAHWFIPLTNATACKHEAFFSPSAIGEAVLEFPSSTLVRGEPDASSFPSGGLRATFEARGYTTWDPTSPAFVRSGTLYIPSVFSSYGGEALDQKIPLLKSIEALNVAGLQFLKFFPIANDATRIHAYAGPEQEYFLVPRDLYKRRPDLRLCGRTLLGIAPSKGQQLEDHYMGHVKLDVADYMSGLDYELWMIGVPAKTKHNEVAPAQHELAPVYEAVNTAADHNQMTMETMRDVAKRHNLACLLHEKPFAGLNGSGKHNNFSIGTDTGINFFSPREFADDGGLFLLSVCALIRSVHIYGDLLRCGAATPSNDQRLGGFEAPPPILSVYLGEAVQSQLLAEADGSLQRSTSRDAVAIVPALPDLQPDDSDRNRTSPFAFTGNKFEFRMLGSSQSIAQINTILCTILADSLAYFAGQLDGAEDLDAAKKRIIAETVRNHGNVIFNGNNYSKEWEVEAQRRGLPIITNTVDALAALLSEKNITLFERTNVLTKGECEARYEIQVEAYAKTVEIEANTLLKMVRRQVIPAVIGELGKLAASVSAVKAAGITNPAISAPLEKLAALFGEVTALTDQLEAAAAEKTFETAKAAALHARDQLLPLMDKIRVVVDGCEAVIDPAAWPFPSYHDLLYAL